MCPFCLLIGGSDQLWSLRALLPLQGPQQAQMWPASDCGPHLAQTQPVPPPQHGVGQVSAPNQDPRYKCRHLISVTLTHSGRRAKASVSRSNSQWDGLGPRPPSGQDEGQEDEVRTLGSGLWHLLFLLRKVNTWAQLGQSRTDYGKCLSQF